MAECADCGTAWAPAPTGRCLPCTRISVDKWVADGKPGSRDAKKGKKK